MTRLVLGSLGLLAAVSLVLSCSSGIGKNVQRPTPAASVLNPNRATGLDLGLTPSTVPSEPSAAGVVVPAIGGTAARDVMLVAFSSASAADNGDGNGTPISRDAVTDTNGGSDIFVAAISAQDIETRAFSQSLAGKFRHPRCTTCHSMQASDTQAFVSSPQPHAGPTPGPTFPNNRPSECTRCHGNAEVNASPTPTWQAPAASFDFRHKTVAELADAAGDVPNGDLTHFESDARVLWALDTGITPTFGGRNGVADDDHDGVLEPEDTDGTPRPVPGGSAVLLSQIRAWIDSGRVVSTANAVKDVTLASRAASNVAASNGVSSAAKVLWVPNASFDPTDGNSARATNPVGTLHVVFQSTGSDIAGTDGNSLNDVFRVAIDLRAEEDVNGAPLTGGLNLVYRNDAAVLCSATNGTTTAGNDASTQPTIGGTTADVVAFTSLATNLISGFSNANGSGADVYVRKIGSQVTTLVSHSTSNQATSGNGHSEGPSLDATGAVLAFESDATNLVSGDTNTQRDVFYATVTGVAPFTRVRASLTAASAQAQGGGASKASVHVAGSRVRVAFQSDATNMVTSPASGVTSNVYLFDSTSGESTLLNQKLTPDASAKGDDDARSPVIAADGAHVAFESDASNIDTVRTTDLTHGSDVFVVATDPIDDGIVAPFRLSVTTREGADANGGSGNASFGSFSGSANYPVGFVVYTTAATNLGASDSTNFLVGFLQEQALVASFTTDVTRGQAPLTVTFADTSAGAPTGWSWDFDGDGTVDSTAQNPAPFVFATPGSYTARLVISKDGRTASATQSIIAVSSPTASFTVNATTGLTTSTFQFTDTSTQSPTSWAWDFDNNGSVDSTLQNPTKVYASAGTYSVRLTVTNEAGSASTTSTNLISVFLPVVANFTTNTTSGAAPLSVTFTNTSTGATSYVWDFGDSSSTVTTTNATHSYTVGGSFTATLTATGPGGTSTQTTTISVASSASFTVSGGGGTGGLSAYESTTLTFTSTSTGAPTTFTWDFDSVSNPGARTASGASATQTFTNVTSSTRSFVVKLTVNGPGGSAQTTRTVTIVSDTETASLNPNADTTIYSNVTGNSNGAGTSMVAGATISVGNRRALVRFSLASIPSGSTASTATMTVTNVTPNATGTQSIGVHRATQAWTEGTAAAVSQGQGTATAGSGATWVNRTGSTGWSTAGGTFVAATSTISVTDAATTFTSGSLLGDVNGWLDGTLANNGWVLVGNESTTRTVKWFGTRESGTPPVLDITYTRPLP